MENSVKNASKRPLRVRFLRVICVFQGTFTVVLVRLPLQRCVYFCILRARKRGATLPVAPVAPVASVAPAVPVASVASVAPTKGTTVPPSGPRKRHNRAPQEPQEPTGPSGLSSHSVPTSRGPDSGRWQQRGWGPAADFRIFGAGKRKIFWRVGWKKKIGFVRVEETSSRRLSIQAQNG